MSDFTGHKVRDRCGICGRRLVSAYGLLAAVRVKFGLDGRMDCGGDCWRCVREAETQ